MGSVREAADPKAAPAKTTSQGPGAVQSAPAAVAAHNQQDGNLNTARRIDQLRQQASRSSPHTSPATGAGKMGPLQEMNPLRFEERDLLRSGNVFSARSLHDLHDTTRSANGVSAFTPAWQPRWPGRAPPTARPEAELNSAKAALERVGSEAELRSKYRELLALKGTIADRGNLGAPGLDLFDQQQRWEALEAWLESRDLSIAEFIQLVSRLEKAFRAVATETAHAALHAAQDLGVKFIENPAALAALSKALFDILGLRYAGDSIPLALLSQVSFGAIPPLAPALRPRLDIYGQAVRLVPGPGAGADPQIAAEEQIRAVEKGRQDALAETTEYLVERNFPFANVKGFPLEKLLLEAWTPADVSSVLSSWYRTRYVPDIRKVYELLAEPGGIYGLDIVVKRTREEHGLNSPMFGPILDHAAQEAAAVSWPRQVLDFVAFALSLMAMAFPVLAPVSAAVRFGVGAVNVWAAVDTFQTDYAANALRLKSAVPNALLQAVLWALESVVGSEDVFVYFAKKKGLLRALEKFNGHRQLLILEGDLNNLGIAKGEQKKILQAAADFNAGRPPMGQLAGPAPAAPKAVAPRPDAATTPLRGPAGGSDAREYAGPRKYDRAKSVYREGPTSDAVPEPIGGGNSTDANATSRFYQSGPVTSVDGPYTDRDALPLEQVFHERYFEEQIAEEVDQEVEEAFGKLMKE